MHEIFHHEIFFETEKSSSKFFMVLGHKKNPTEKGDYPPPFLSINFFHSGTFLNHKGRRTTFFVLVSFKKIRRENAIPSLLSKTFFHTSTLQKHKGPPNEIFRYCEKKIQKNRDAPASPLLHDKFHHQNFFESKKVSLTTFFGTVRQKLSDGKT